MNRTSIEDAAHAWPSIEFCDAVPPIACEAEYIFANSILDYLGDHGATREGSPHASLYRKLFDVVYDYEQLHRPYLTEGQPGPTDRVTDR